MDTLEPNRRWVDWFESHDLRAMVKLLRQPRVEQWPVRYIFQALQSLEENFIDWKLAKITQKWTNSGIVSQTDALMGNRCFCFA